MALSEPACNQRLRPLTARLNPAGRWEVGGCDLAELATTYGTPLYVMDETTLLAAAGAYKDALALHYPGPSEAVYASKALCTMAIDRLLFDAGMGIEVVSAGELVTVLKAGVAPEKIYFQGSNKSPEEVRLALEEGVGRFVVDNLDELAMLSELAAELGIKANVLLRVTPGVDAHTHDFVRTGHVDTKFGLVMPHQLDQAIECILAGDALRFCGLHAHIGSQIFDIDPFLANVDVLLDLAVRLRDTFGLPVAELDVGGGLGIAYGDGDDPPSIGELVGAVAKHVREGCERRDLPLPKLLMEPGRSIVGTAGLTVYRVGARKEIPGVRTYLSVDGGMADNPRPITYGARYEADPVQLAERTETVTLCGKACESGDVVIEELKLPRLSAGDAVVVWSTGAYCYSMASNYNRLARPALVLVADGRAEVLSERETLADLMARDRLPTRLGGTR